ncbi:MAG: hypothetical protein ACI9HI_000220 [Salinirussus sp.]|jgi:hypothetical protein
MEDQRTRRQYLRAVGLVGAGAVAGCTGESPDNSPEGEQKIGGVMQFQYGPGHTGQAAGETVPTTGVTERWRYDTAEADVGTVAVVDGTVYFGATGGQVYALAADNGSKRWVFQQRGQAGRVRRERPASGCGRDEPGGQRGAHSRQRHSLRRRHRRHVVCHPRRVGRSGRSVNRRCWRCRCRESHDDGCCLSELSAAQHVTSWG